MSASPPTAMTSCAKARTPRIKTRSTRASRARWVAPLSARCAHWNRARPRNRGSSSARTVPPQFGCAVPSSAALERRDSALEHRQFPLRSSRNTSCGVARIACSRKEGAACSSPAPAPTPAPARAAASFVQPKQVADARPSQGPGGQGQRSVEGSGRETRSGCAEARTETRLRDERP